MSNLANPEKAVAMLLQRLEHTKQTMNTDEGDPLAEKVNEIEDSLKDLKLLLPKVEHWEQKLFDHLNHCLRYLDNRMLDRVHEEIAKIKSSVSLLQNLPVPDEAVTDDRTSRYEEAGHRDDKGPKDLKASQIVSELEESILVDPALKFLEVSYDNLDRLELRLCLLFLSVFPENAVIKKRTLIYWWIGEGLMATEEDGEKIFEEFLKRDLIKPFGNGKCPVVNKCQIHPWIRYLLISLARDALLFNFDSKGVPLFDITRSRRACLVRDAWNSSIRSTSNYEYLWTIFNVNENYLDFDPSWVARLKRLVVLQLGRWQDLPDHHIEVQNEAFLKVLSTQKHLKYLSLRGISKITLLPPSIVELVFLEILDLKACHNLETLPADIGPLKKLTHLDISECYLLESMPKGLEKLPSLQVLKGFIVGNSDNPPCRIGNLKSLERLKRLSIHIGNDAVIQDGEFDKLKDLIFVRHLKISWNVVSQELKERVGKQSFSFPAELEKLVLEGIPQEEVPEWLKPSKLMALKELHIRGGKLNSLGHSDDGRWKVEILRLEYMENLTIGLPELKKLFPSLIYVQLKWHGAREEEFEWRQDEQ